MGPSSGLIRRGRKSSVPIWNMEPAVITKPSAHAALRPAVDAHSGRELDNSHQWRTAVTLTYLFI